MKRQVYASNEKLSIVKLEQYQSPKYSDLDLERFRAIENEFQMLDTDKSGQLSRQEIIACLLQKGCPKQLIDEIFNDLNSDQDQYISKSEFSHGYLQKENNIKKQIQDIETAIQEQKCQQSNLRVQIPQGRVLILSILSGCLSQKYKNDPNKLISKVELHIQKDAEQRVTKPSLNVEYPLFGDQFKYQIDSRQNTFIFEIIEEQNGQRKSLGQVTVEKKFGQDFNVEEVLKFPNLGEITIKFEYFDNYEEHCQFESSQIASKIQENYVQANQLKQKLYFIQQLFGKKGQLSPQPQPMFNLSALVQQETIVIETPKPKEIQPLQISISPPPQAIFYGTQELDTMKQSPKTIPIMNQFDQFLNPRMEFNPINVQDIHYQRRYYMIILLSVLITLEMAFGHSDQLSLLILLLALPYQQQYTQEQLKLLTYILIGSSIMDVYWLKVYVNCFSSNYCSEVDIFAITWVMALITLALKLVFLYYIRRYQ